MLWDCRPEVLDRPAAPLACCRRDGLTAMAAPPERLHTVVYVSDAWRAGYSKTVLVNDAS